MDRALDLIGNLWFGISMMVLILVYCWLGSAGTQPLIDWFPRQTLDKTEMEWFTWWPFNLMVGLLALSLLTATIRKIPFNLPNLGVWMVHVGILVMIGGAVVYYSLKIEGDMAVYRRQATIQVDGGTPETLVLRPREQTVVQGDGRVFRVSVADLNPGYELLTGDDQGETTYAAQLRFEPMGGGGEPFIRQLLVGYPEYTEDVLPGRGRAIKVTGSALVDEAVSVDLGYASTSRLFVNSEYAIYAREAGSGEAWTQLPVDGLPRYHEHVALSGDAFVPRGAPQPEVGELEVRPDLSALDPELAEGLGLAITGYLPYATETTDWVAGGDRLNPMLTFTLTMGGASQTETLLALDPRRNALSFGSGLPTITFRWIEDAAVLERLRKPSSPRLVVDAPGLSEPRTLPLSELEGEPRRLEGTDYTLQLEQLFPNWQMASRSGTAQLALVRVDGPTGTFRRAVVAPNVEMSQDITEGGHGGGGLIDEELRIELKGLRESGLVLVAGPVGLHVLMLDEQGVVEEHAPEEGQPVELLDGQLELTIDQLSQSARQVRKPMVVPHAERQRRTEAFSMVQLEVRHGTTARSVWLDYSHYAHPNRGGFHPAVVTLDDGRRLELLFSRASMELPTEVALEEFQLEVFPGGERERDYISLVRFREGEAWSEVREVRSNQPTEQDGWWFFQSTWDPPAPQMNYAGMNYTGLGVGNRHGVGIMLLGGVLTVVGSIWAFYVKPVLIRRRREGRAPTSAPAGAPSATGAGPGPAPLTGHPSLDARTER